MRGIIIGLLALGALVGCSSGSSGGSSSTFAISGTMGGMTSMHLAREMSMGEKAGAYGAQVLDLVLHSGRGYGDGVQSVFSNQCADGNFYRVMCTSWSVPPVSAYADVSCSGANSGSFTVSGLPLNTEISCFVRKSSDGSTFEPFATLELPSVGLGGSTDVISANGNMAINISVDSEGSLTAVVTAGDNKADDNVGSTTSSTTTFNGFWRMTCDASGNSAEQNNRCKCFLDESSYANKDACLSDNASLVPNNMKLEIDLNLYNATVGANVDFENDGKDELTAGQTVQGVSVWQADCSVLPCTSARGAGGEGLTNMGGVLTWAAAQATNAISWTTGMQTLAAAEDDIGCGANSTGNANLGDAACTATIGAIPAANATRGTWLTWYTNLVTSSNWTCYYWQWSAGMPAFTSVSGMGLANNAYCLSEFSHRIYERVRNSNMLLPRIRFDACPGGSCSDAAPSAAIIDVEGLHFNGSGAGATPDSDSIGFGPAQRYVFEQWFPFSNGGGGFRQRYDDRRFLPCLSGMGTNSQQGIYNCPAQTFGIECMTMEELNLKMMPTSTTGIMNMGFNMTNTVRRAFIRSGNNSHNGLEIVGAFNAYNICRDVMGTSAETFVAKGTKM